MLLVIIAGLILLSCRTIIGMLLLSSYNCRILMRGCAAGLSLSHLFSSLSFLQLSLLPLGLQRLL